MPVRVMYDAQTFLRQRTGGISRLFSDLIATFADTPEMGVDPVLPFRWTNSPIAAQALRSQGIRCTPELLPRGVLYAPAWVRGTPHRQGVDLLHHTYYARRFLQTATGRRRAVTVYDMIPELFQGSPYATGTHLAKRRFVECSDLVICISESTRRDLLDLYGSVSAEVRVVPLSVDTVFAPGLPPLPNVPAECLLYVGGRGGYKDFGLLPKALRALRSEGLVPPVLVVGKPFTRAERTSLDALGLGSQVTQLALSDSDLRRAYSNCSAVIQTSRYEGFGLTPLEGMASGAPVIVADASSMPEVCEDVGVYFQPGDAESLAGAIASLLVDTARRADLSVRGPLRAAHFTPQHTATLTAAAYRDVIASGSAD